jgi:myo-inositol-1(or 4)-monophosphatase
MGNVAGKEWQSERIARLLVRSGRYAMDRWRGEGWRLKSDGSLVTDVDEALERDLTDALESVPDGIHVIGEETVSSRGESYVQNALAQRAYVVDPIDGTAPFAHGISYWGTSIGYMEEGRLLHGGIVIPAQNELFVTDGDKVLWTNQLDLTQDNPPELRALEPVLAPWGPGGMVALGQRMVRMHTFPWPNPTLVSGCAINALAYLMVGRFSAYLGHMKLWDLAGVLPMLLRCGCGGRLINGTMVGQAVTDAVYDLCPGSQARWALRDDCLFGTPSAFTEFYGDIRAHLEGERQ